MLLHGYYTIGGISPDYATFNDAVSDLENNGVSGPVIFNVRSGSYNEQVKISTFSGASSTNTVIFQSETGNSDEVILHHKHTGTTTNFNYTIFIESANFLIFRNMTIKADPEDKNSTDKNRVIYIHNNSNNLSFINNKILSWHTLSNNSGYNNCIHVGADQTQSRDNDSISFINNIIVGGYVGLNLFGSNNSGDYETTGWVIENNTITDQGLRGIEARIAKNIRISGNVIENSRLKSTWFGVTVMQFNDSLRIENNTIHTNGAGTGIFLSHLNQSSAAFKQVSNNMITFGPDYESGTPVGIYTSNICPTIIAHNSVNMYSSYPSGACLFSAGNDSLLIYNNQFANFGDQLVYYIQSNSSQIVSDYNNLYSTGSVLARIHNNNYSSLPSMYSATGLDENSLSINPKFTSNKLLISYEPSTFSAGTPIPTVPFDFFGTPRSTIAPNIGVYEGAFPTTDVAIIGSSLDNYTPCPNDILDLYIYFQNKGTNILTSLNLYYINNDITYGPISWSGSLNQNNIDSILIPSFTLPQTQYVTLTIYSNEPNGEIDQIPQNDKYVFESVTALNGTYTIGTISSDYESFSEAVWDLVEFGVCGPVVFEIAPGSYNEQFIIPKISGTSFTNTITFRSATLDSSDVEIWFNNTSLNNYVVLLDGAEYIHFESLKIRPANSSQQIGVLFKLGASYNEFSYCHIIGTSVQANNSRALIYFTPFSSGQYMENKFHHNRFENGGYQLRVAGNTNKNAFGTELCDNIFTGNAGISIDLENHIDGKIARNIFEGVRAGSGSGIQLKGCEGDLLIEKNKIGLNSSGVVFKIISCTTNTLIIRNNFIASSTSNMEISNVSNIKLVNNSFHTITSTGSNLIMYGNNTNFELYNNAMLNSGGNTCCNFLNVINLNQVAMDYNSFYTTGKHVFRENSVYYKISDWQSYTGLETNSLNTIPFYTSDMDLHIVNSGALFKAAIPLSFVSDDINGVPRDLVSPCIGAHEFTIDSTNYFDLQIYSILEPDTALCSAPESLMISIVNKSNFTMNSFDIKWSLFGLKQDSITYNLNIPPRDTINLTVTAFEFVPNTYYDFDFELLLPNGNSDNYPNDNVKSIQYQHLSHSIIRQRPRHDCTSDIELFVTNSRYESILWSTGETTKSIVTTGPGIYTVTVTDRYGCTVTDNILVN